MMSSILAPFSQGGNGRFRGVGKGTFTFFGFFFGFVGIASPPLQL